MNTIGQQQAFSWTVHSKETIAKKIDRSVILYKMTGIPVEVRWFFDLNQLSPGDKQDVLLQYNGKNYEAYFSMSVQRSLRTRLTWGGAFAHELEKALSIDRSVIKNTKEESEDLGDILFEKKSNILYKVFLKD